MTEAHTDEPGHEDVEILRRHFVAIATAVYDDPNYPSLPVDKEIDQLKAWLCDEKRLGNRAFMVPALMADLARQPTGGRIQAALRHPKTPWTHRDAAVVFVTGHGEVANRSHWTVLKDSSSNDLPGTALRTDDLVSWLAATQIEHLLLIIDTCFAGAIAEEICRRDKELPVSWLILPSAMKDQKAVAGAVTEAIGQAVDKLKGGEGRKYGIDDEFFAPAAFLDTVKDFLDPKAQTLDQIFRGRLTVPHVCLPNPHFTSPSVVPTQSARHELALPKQDLQTHWGPRARGVARDDTPGWLFTGRADLMRELIRTLDGPPGTTLDHRQRRVRQVGSPGPLGHSVRP